MLAANNQRQFVNLVVLGHPEWAQTRAGRSRGARAANQDALRELFKSSFFKLPADEWESLLDQAGVLRQPCA